MKFIIQAITQLSGLTFLKLFIHLYVVITDTFNFMENNELKLGAEKDFAVPVEKLYQAWITPEDLKQWWKPSENHLTTVNLDVREGGKFKYEFEGKDHQIALAITGDYKEVKPNEKLMYSWNWDIPTDTIKPSDHELTIEFVANGDGSKIKVTQKNFQDDESITPHQEGWDKALNDLQAYLNQK
ncbi:SRPBCC domain-containing protein [Mucilaginibacter robiniae]|uniref:SRPBCC domain-containing protein n=1 Tax=Mucilaginibacter robiniae TaxID=2728022 RepID=A0A7L5E298_9SPHI|nr:SRPBCC domain-containing protein [Mucilaginibacter robiniae]QJD97151.1 SRPBCC domain-containing protein [Mucilaginibacter robiniae]